MAAATAATEPFRHVCGQHAWRPNNTLVMKKKEYSSHKVSVIVSTYNRPDALEVCLRSLFCQTVLPYEIVVGDDGSGEPTRQLIEKMKAVSPVPIIHVWHEDSGFRLAMMRNKSIAATHGDYIIEMDGDIFAHPHFIEDHLHEAAPGRYVKGGRTNLGKALTERICRSGMPTRIHYWTKGIESKPENSIHCSWLAHLLAPRYRKHRSAALGCNMSFFKSDIIRVNGYDEFYEGWGGEDVDLGYRLQMSGLSKRYLKFAGIVYHLWHEDKYMYNKDKNIAHGYECEKRGKWRCDNGLDKYLPSADTK